MSKDVTKSTQHRLMVTDKDGNRFSLFDNLSYGLDTMKIAHKAHLELGSDPVIQKRAVKVTFEYGEWEEVQ